MKTEIELLTERVDLLSDRVFALEKCLAREQASQRKNLSNLQVKVREMVEQMRRTASWYQKGEKHVPSENTVL